MFGGRAFLVDGRLVVSVREGGRLLVRVPEGRYDSLLSRPGAGRAHMGAGRGMSRGWLDVEAHSFSQDQLSFWLGTALDAAARSTSGDA